MDAIKIQVSSSSEIQEHLDILHKAARSAVNDFKKMYSVLEPLELLYKIKFEPIGRNPSDNTELNLIEQVNQTFTFLVTLKAADLLLRKHPGINLQLNLGPFTGYDICTTDESIIAETFAAVHPNSNNKLRADCMKVEDHSHAKERYVFFYSPAIFKSLEKTQSLFPRISIVKLETLLIDS